MAEPTTTDLPADSMEEMEKTAANCLKQGKRNLLLKEIALAAAALGEACKLFTESKGTFCMDSAESHYYYGKALLEQSRLDLNMFETPAAQDVAEESEEEEPEPEGSDQKDEDKENKSSEEGEDPETEEDPEEDPEADLNEASPAEQPSSSEAEIASTVADEQPGPSRITVDDEVPSTSTGVKAEVEEELSDLELAWEALEVAKVSYMRQLEDTTDKGEKDTILRKLADTHLVLGEIATESENYSTAVEEYEIALGTLAELGSEEESREVAQIHFHLGLTLASAKKFDAAIGAFEKSMDIITKRLEKAGSEESEELRTLIPELEEKVMETKEAKAEFNRNAVEEAKEEEKLKSPIKAPLPPANDISHLVKKRKKEEMPAPTTEQPPMKKQCPDVENGHSENGNGVSSTEK